MKVKIFLFFVLIGVVVTEENVNVNLSDEETDLSEMSQNPMMTASMNAYMDLIMIQVGPFISRMGWIPMDLPDFHEQLEHRVLLVTYRGHLNLWNGALTRLVSVARHGNAFMTYQNKRLIIQVAASIRNVAFRYDYDAEIMGLGPTGWLEGSVAQINIGSDFTVDFNTFMISVQNFRIISLGSISINLRGNPLIDWLSGLIINTVANLFRGPIANFITARLHELVQETVNEMNNRNRAAMLEGRPIDFEKMIEQITNFKLLGEM